MDHITLRQLEVFRTLAQLGSFTAAAKALHVTQPAVSAQVKELESHCGVALYERTGRNIRLTDAGAHVADCAERVADVLEETSDRLDALRGLRSGVLRLGAVSTAKYFAPALLAAFQNDFPEVAIRFSVANREEIVGSLADNEVDLVIMGRPPREIETVARAFAKHPLGVVTAPTHPLAARRGISIGRLERENFLIREVGSGTRAAMERIFRQSGVRYSASMEVSSNETIKQAVMAGMGVAFLSLHTVGLEVRAGRLSVLDVTGFPVERKWYVLHRKRKRLSPIASAFRDLVIERGAQIIAHAVA